MKRQIVRFVTLSMLVFSSIALADVGAGKVSKVERQQLRAAGRAAAKEFLRTTPFLHGRPTIAVPTKLMSRDAGGNAHATVHINGVFTNIAGMPIDRIPYFKASAVKQPTSSEVHVGAFQALPVPVSLTATGQ